MAERKYVDKQIEELQKANTVLKKLLTECKSAAIDTFNRGGLPSAYDIETKIIRNEIKIEALTYWSSICGENSELKISDWFEVQLYDTGIVFNITDEHIGEAYEYVCDSYSMLCEEVTERLPKFLGPVVDYGGWRQESFGLESAMTFFSKRINEITSFDEDKYHYKDKVANYLKRLVEALTSEKAKRYLALADEYIKMLVEDRKKEY